MAYFSFIDSKLSGLNFDFPEHYCYYMIKSVALLYVKKTAKMTPIGHASVSVIAGTKLSRKQFYALLFGSLIPDIDFLLLPFDIFNSLHRLLTHNLIFVLIATLVFMAIVGIRDYRTPLLFLAGGIVHLCIDSILDSNPSNGVGVALFWPISDNYVSPTNLLENYPSQYTWDQPVKFLLSLWRGFIIELPFIIVALLVLPKRLTSVRDSNIDQPSGKS